MRTAMQELIEKLHARCDFCLEKELISEWGTLRMTIIEAQSLLEKEKEQIIEAGNVCSIKTIVHKEKLDEMSENELRDSLVEDTISYGEEYYNQTYNQKQHIIDIMKADEDDGLYDQNK
jgi:DNA-binding GntR family transcriptional regulator